MTHFLGLTGSIGMGKSTTAKMFLDEGVPVWDADAVVHKLYASEGAAVKLIQSIYPEAVVDGVISRDRLSSLIATDPRVLTTLESVIHPLVAKDRADFIVKHSAPLLVFDIPLLFETGADDWLDSVLVVSVDPDTQKKRVLARPEMTQLKFETIVERQLADADKRKRADYVIETYCLESTQKEVQTLIAELLGHENA